MKSLFKHGRLLCALLLVAAFPGCPPISQTEYDLGYWDGFLTDSKYWEGFDDSYMTVPNGPLLYTGSEIPDLTDGSYDDGYWDGIWYAYNDGYFVSYDYGFTIGFSEGYDVAYHPGWVQFLSNDVHNEYLDGSFEDGYQDGFSEGSVFGAYDYKTGLAFDWEDAMWDYRKGTDVYLEEVGIGTGESEIVFLYEYGVDPATYYTKSETASGNEKSPPALRKRDRKTPAVRKTPENDLIKSGANKSEEEITYRPLPNQVRDEFNKRPERSPRSSETALTLQDTWLQRIERYRAQQQ